MLQLRSPSDQVNVVRFIATDATVAKVPFVQNGRAYIPMNDGDAATAGEHVYCSEVSDAAKAAGEAWAVGADLYWDDTAKEFTTTATDNTLCGYALQAAESADTVSPIFLFNSHAA